MKASAPFLLALGTSACAPLSDLRPPSALSQGDTTFEAGAGVARISKRPYVDEDPKSTGQVWFTGRAARWLNLSAVGAFDAHAAAGGVSALARYVTTDRFVAGVGVEGGFAWGAASLSAAGRLFDRTWLYTAPRFGNWGDVPSVGIPAGLSARIVGGFQLRVEGQVSWADFKYYNRRIHLAAAGVYEW